MSAAVPPDASVAVDAEASQIVAKLRTLLIVLAGAIAVATAVELAMLRHWTEETQVIAWGALVALGVATALVAGAPSPGRVRAARLLAIVVGLAGLIGVVLHINANHEAGPLDREYGDTWDSMSAAAQWWAAASGAVGPSPALASGILVVGAVCIVGATIGRSATSES